MMIIVNTQAVKTRGCYMNPNFSGAQLSVLDLLLVNVGPVGAFDLDGLSGFRIGTDKQKRMTVLAC